MNTTISDFNTDLTNNLQKIYSNKTINIEDDKLIIKEPNETNGIAFNIPLYYSMYNHNIMTIHDICQIIICGYTQIHKED